MVFVRNAKIQIDTNFLELQRPLIPQTHRAKSPSNDPRHLYRNSPPRHTIANQHRSRTSKKATPPPSTPNLHKSKSKSKPPQKSKPTKADKTLDEHKTPPKIQAPTQNPPIPSDTFHERNSQPCAHYQQTSTKEVQEPNRTEPNRIPTRCCVDYITHALAREVDQP